MLSLALMAGYEEGGEWSVVGPLTWVRLWFKRPERFCALGIRWAQFEIKVGPYAGQKAPRAIVLRDFIIADINRRKGTRYQTWRLVNPC